MGSPILEVKDLTTSFRIRGEFYPAVDQLSLTVHENEVVAIVGESGCGKSAFAHSIMGLHNLKNTKLEGEVNFKSKNLLHLSTAEMNKVRGKDIGMIFQDPMTALNPLSTIGRQIEEPMDYHMPELSKKEKRDRAIELLRRVGIRNEKRVYGQYPHELSGGMRQRVVIAIAMACDPVMLIADEPTTALDVTIQAQIIDLMKELQSEMKSGIILITHDLGVVAEMADRVAVMYAGQIVEIAEVHELFTNPMHPYTRSLLNSIPSGDDSKERLHVIKGIVPPLDKLDRTGCRFAPRIDWIPEEAHVEHPPIEEVKQGHFVRCTCYKHFHFPGEEIGGVDDVATEAE